MHTGKNMVCHWQGKNATNASSISHPGSKNSGKKIICSFSRSRSLYAGYLCLWQRFSGRWLPFVFWKQAWNRLSLPCHKPGEPSSLVRLRGTRDGATGAAGQGGPGCDGRATSSPSSWSHGQLWRLGSRRCGSCLPAERGQGHRDKVINKEREWRDRNRGRGEEGGWRIKKI